MHVPRCVHVRTRFVDSNGATPASHVKTTPHYSAVLWLPSLGPKDSITLLFSFRLAAGAATRTCSRGVSPYHILTPHTCRYHSASRGTGRHEKGSPPLIKLSIVSQDRDRLPTSSLLHLTAAPVPKQVNKRYLPATFLSKYLKHLSSIGMVLTMIRRVSSVGYQIRTSIPASVAMKTCSLLEPVSM